MSCDEREAKKSWQERSEKEKKKKEGGKDGEMEEWRRANDSA